MKILISDPLAEKGVEVLKKCPGIEVDIILGLSEEGLKKIIKDCQGLIVRSETKVTSDVISQAKEMKIIGRAGAGVDNIDVDAATKRGIIVMNAPGGNTITTAEHATSLMLALSRKIPQANISMREGKWEKNRFLGQEIFQKTLGIIGLGRIGSIVADRALGLKMKVIAYDPYIFPEVASKMGVELVSLEELFSRSDYISLHLPLTPETRNLLNIEAFRKMKKGVKIINCARGGIINERALCEAIKEGIVSGAALDVFEKEPPGKNPLLQLEEVISTPHLGAATDEAQVNVAILIAQQIVDYFTNGTIRNAVNFPPLSPEIFSQIKPYLSLAESLGNFQAQTGHGSIENVTLEYSGEVVELEVAPITAAALKGLLSPILEEEINFVNAPIIAKERGVKVIESKSSKDEGYTNLVTLKVKRAQKENLVAGTLFSKNDPRIVRVDNFRLEAIPKGHTLLLYSYDRPGVIGNIGTTLGNYEINIARMEFGREKKEGKSLIFMNTDDPVPEEVLKKLKALPNIISVKRLTL